MAKAESGQRHFKRGIVKMCLSDHCRMLITHDSPFDRECGVLKDKVLVAKEKEIGGWEIPHIPRRDNEQPIIG